MTEEEIDKKCQFEEKLFNLIKKSIYSGEITFVEAIGTIENIKLDLYVDDSFTHGLRETYRKRIRDL